MTEGDNRPFFSVALNLPHAGRIARRIERLLPDPSSDLGSDAHAAQRLTAQIVDLLDACLNADENPPPPVSAKLQSRAAELGRKLVDHIEQGKFGHDRLGQCIRNYFECLELGREGAEISLRAGEDPKSMQRPV